MSLKADKVVTADGNSNFTWLSLRKEVQNNGSLFVYGNFGGGTVAVNISPDGGVTFIPMLDQLGNAVSFTSDGMQNFYLNGCSNPIEDQQVVIQFALTGSTSPSLTYRIFDAL